MSAVAASCNLQAARADIVPLWRKLSCLSAKLLRALSAERSCYFDKLPVKIQPLHYSCLNLFTLNRYRDGTIIRPTSKFHDCSPQREMMQWVVLVPLLQNPGKFRMWLDDLVWLRI